jgi:hypothetical protein
LRKTVDASQTKNCLDVANYPALSAFSKTTYKIYAVQLEKKYKSNRILKSQSRHRRQIRGKYAPSRRQMISRLPGDSVSGSRISNRQYGRRYPP